jgi:transcriptional regulator with XRE-family HTH domain
VRGPQPFTGLPSHVLASPEFQRVCRERDFTQVFLLVKRRAGVYPSRIASLCGMTPSRVGEIMTGRRGLAHIDVIERVADGLRIPGALLGLAHRPWEVPKPPTTASQANERSHTPVDEPSPAAESTEPSGIDDLLTLADGTVTRSTLVALRSSVEDYWRRDDEHGGASLRPAVVGHLRYVSQVMKGADGALLRDLQALATELARLAGWAYFDARQYSTARTHFTQALRLAHHQDDRVFEVPP